MFNVPSIFIVLFYTAELHSYLVSMATRNPSDVIVSFYDLLITTVLRNFQNHYDHYELFNPIIWSNYPTRKIVSRIEYFCYNYIQFVI